MFDAPHFTAHAARAGASTGDPLNQAIEGSPTATLASRMCEVTFDSLGAETVAVVKRLVADGIAVAVAGAREEAPAIAAAHA
jgi:hypothetical protein